MSLNIFYRVLAENLESKLSNVITFFKYTDYSFTHLLEHASRVNSLLGTGESFFS